VVAEFVGVDATMAGIWSGGCVHIVRSVGTLLKSSNFVDPQNSHAQDTRNSLAESSGYVDN